MTNRDTLAENKQKSLLAMAEALRGTDENAVTTAMNNFYGCVRDEIMADAREVAQMQIADNAALAARGCRVLTSAENAYWKAWAQASKSPNPKAALTNLEVAMPDSVLDGVMDNIRKNHPLLDRLNFVNTSYISNFILNAKPGQAAVWGAIGSGITKQLDGAFKKFSVTMMKLSCYMEVPLDFLDLGPEWLDRYARETIAETIACSIETAVVDGTGKDQPIGMTRDVSDDVTVTGGVYPRMTAIPVNDLSPATLCGLVAKLARDPADPTKARKVGDMILLFNPLDYWAKVRPALSYQLRDGTWTINTLPIPAEILQSEALARNAAVIGLPKKYFMGLGVLGKNGMLGYSDEAQYLEDVRTYKSKFQGNGRPMDAYAFLYLDITGLSAPAPATEEEKGENP